jgi:hypothetical protein
MTGAGRPSSLDLPYDEHRTIADFIIEAMATGASVDDCANAAGVDRSSLHTWLKLGARTRTALARGELGWPDDPDAEKPPPDTHALRCMRFSDSVEKARAEWLLRLETLLDARAQPLTKVIETVTVDKDGNETDRTTRTEYLGPDMATIRWRAERHPASRHRYGARQALELSGPDGGDIPIAQTAANLLDQIRTLRGHTTDTPPPTDTPDADG